MWGRWQSQQRTPCLPPSPPTPAPNRNRAWQGLLISLSALRLTSGRRTIWSGPPRVWRPRELSEARSSLAVMSMLPPPPPSCWPPLFVLLALLCPRGALPLWFHSLSQCGWLLVGVMSQHGVRETTVFNFSWAWWLTAAKMSQWETS